MNIKTGWRSMAIGCSMNAIIIFLIAFADHSSAGLDSAFLYLFVALLAFDKAAS